MLVGARPTHATSGKSKVKELGITKVFDLRSDTEIRKYNTPLPEIDGVEVIHVPVFKTEDYSPEMMAKYVRACISSLRCLFSSM